MAHASGFLTLVVLLAPNQEPAQKTPAERNPFAPSLPLLTEKEEEKLDAVVDRFIEADTGDLHGQEAKKARQDFEKLGPEATFALIRGLNKAAKIEHSCPVVTIARKLSKMFEATADTELLQFARENIGADVGPTRHANVLKNLKLTCSLRKSALVRAGITGTPVLEERSLKTGSLKELINTASSDHGVKQKEAIQELGKQKGDEAINALAAVAATAYDREVQQMARDHLGRCLARLTSDELKTKLRDERDEVRLAAVRRAGRKPEAWGKELIEALGDANQEVREEAHRGLLALSQGKDLGATAKLDKTEFEAIQAKWKEWLKSR